MREIFSTFADVGTSYEEACNKLDENFTPQKILIYERWTFKNANQMNEETTISYISRLRKLIATCEYVNPDDEIRTVAHK